MRTIKNQKGDQIAISDITHGILTTDMDFPDYGLKIGWNYVIHTTESAGPYFFGNGGAGETRLNNNELRDDVLPHLMINIK